MKKRIKAQSGLITTVLIILLVLAGVVVVWNVVYGLIKKSSDDIQINTLINRVEVASTKFYATGRTLVNVKSNANIDINKVNIILNLKDGSNMVFEKNIIIRPMETIPVFVYSNETNLSNAQIISVSVVPVFGSKLGLEAKETAPQIDSNGNRALELPDKLISWWKFDSDAKDSVGGNHGTPYGGAKIQNVSLNLNGTSYIELNSIITLSKSNTFSFWAFPIKDLYDHGVLGDSPSGSYKNYLTLSISGDILYFVLRDNLNNYKVLQSTKLTGLQALNSWHFYALVFNSTNVAVYSDGIYDGIFSLFPDNFYPKYIGTGYSLSEPSGRRFNGSIDNVMIFNRSLSEDEIKGIYLNQK